MQHRAPERRRAWCQIKMVNTMQKCSRSNVKARKWMETNGYVDIFYFGHGRWSKDLNFQGLEFDGIASVGNTLVLLQIKSNCRCPKKTLAAYEEVSKRFGIKCIWINVPDRKPIEINNLPTQNIKTLSTK